MAYTIKLNGITPENDRLAGQLRSELAEVLKQDGRFKATLSNVDIDYRKGSRDGSRQPGYYFTLSSVRLVTKKAYCGNHPGECQLTPFTAGKKKPVAAFLEWNDWVELHGLVNDLLDKHNADADVWTRPQDAKGHFWMRKGLKRRYRYEYDVARINGFGVEIREWNTGTPDQFVPDAQNDR
jgi:hypothetical protein